LNISKTVPNISNGTMFGDLDRLIRLLCVARVCQHQLSLLPRKESCIFGC